LSNITQKNTLSTKNVGKIHLIFTHISAYKKEPHSKGMWFFLGSTRRRNKI